MPKIRSVKIGQVSRFSAPFKVAFRFDIQGSTAVRQCTDEHADGRRHVKKVAGLIFLLGLMAPDLGIFQVSALSASCPYGTGMSDGCPGAQAHGVMPYTNFADYQKVILVNVNAGTGYTDGTGYTWTSSGGGCSINAQGTVDVIGGKLTNGLVSKEGSGCTSRPRISIPAGAGNGRGGSIVPTVYQSTPHNASTTYNLPGVDYPVGYDNTLSLRDPAGASLPECASYDRSRSRVTIKSNNCTINGFDFTQHDTILEVAGNLTGTVITNNKFSANGNATNHENIQIDAGSCDTTIKYNQFDGGALSGTGSGHALIASINIGCYSGQVVFEYNYCFNVDSKCLNYSGGVVGTFYTVSLTERYNLYTEIGLCRSCSHGEAEYAYSGFPGTVYETIRPWILQFNVAFTHWPELTLATSQIAIEADAVNIADADVEYNYVLVPGPWAATGSNNSHRAAITSSAAIYCGYQEGGNNSSGTMKHNFIDYTGAFFPYNQSGGTCNIAFPSISDVNAVTGRPCNTSACN